MEEAEKRRERLKAMRMKATSDPNPNPNPNPKPKTEQLANPLADNQLPPPPPPLPRFNFFTDPVSNFTSHKPQRPPSLPPSPASGSRSSEMSHSGFHQFHDSYAPRQNFPQARAPYHNPNSTPSGPTGFGSSFPVHQGSPTFSPSPYSSQQFHNSPNPGFGHRGSPYTTHQGSPNLVQHTQGSGSWPNSSPNPGLGHGGSPYPAHQGSPYSEQHTQGSGQWPNRSPNPSPRYEHGPSPSSGYGRGRGQQDGAESPGWRGRGHASYSRAKSYFNSSMVDDPWESLTPVIWKSDDDTKSWGSVKLTSTPNYNQGSARMTSFAKKARVNYNWDYDKPKAEPSLAEFLAAADTEDGDDAGTG